MNKIGGLIPRKWHKAMVSAAAVLGLGLAGAALPVSQASAQVLLKGAFYQPDGHPIINLSREVMDKIEERTEGRVKFRNFGSSTLVPTTEMASGVNDGTAFMAIWYMPYMSKTIPVFDIETIPIWTGGCEGIVKAYKNGLNDIYTEALNRQGLKNVKVAGVSECLPRMLATRTLVRTPAESKGVKVRSVGAEAEMFKSIGASPVNMPMDQAYEAMSRGIIEGVTNAVMMIEDRSQFEMLKYVTRMNLTSVLMHVIYNPDMLNKLSDGDRKIVEDGMLELADHVRAGLTKMDEESIVRVGEKLGVQVYTPNDAEQQEWFAAARSTVETYEEKAKNDPLIRKGLDTAYQFNPQN